MSVSGGTVSEKAVSEKVGYKKDIDIISRSFRLIVLLASLLFLVSVPVVSASTIYVNTTGWWFEGGYFNASLEPLQDAIDNASDWDTIIVKNGEYTAIFIEDKSITLRSENGSKFTTINGTFYGTAVGITSNNVTLSGFTITSRGSHDGGMHIEGNDITIEHCGIVNCTDYGISISNSADVTVKNCQILNNNNVGIGLYDSNSLTIENNTISYHSECGIDTYNLSNSRIFNNTVTSNGAGINIFSSTNNVIYFNDFNNSGNVWFDTSQPPNRWYSLQQMTYTYNGSTYTNYIGNFWSDNLENQDSNGDGIWDYPYYMNSNNSDPYSLVKTRDHYTLAGTVADTTPQPSRTCQQLQQRRKLTDTST